MVNYYSGLIDSTFKNLYTDAISALMYDDALVTPCTIHYGVTKYENCSNCVFDAIGNKSANKFQDGGPMPFPFGSICPMCNGNGKRAYEASENIKLMIVWNYKQFINNNTVNNPEGVIQSITFAKNTPKLKKAKEIIIATDIDKYSRHRFERISDPQPCGFSNEFVECLWKRSG